MWITIVVIGVLLLWGFLAVKSMIKNKKNGGSVTCGGNCAGCSRTCHQMKE